MSTVAEFVIEYGNFGILNDIIRSLISKLTIDCDQRPSDASYLNVTCISIQ